MPEQPQSPHPTTTIHCDRPEATHVSIVVHDLLGREVARLLEGDVQVGDYQRVWDGRDASGRELPAGLFIARMVTPGYAKFIKMVLLK